jgi:ribosome-binding ATPase
VLVLLNIDEADMPRAADLATAAQARLDRPRTLVDALSARIEMEIGELEEGEGAAFRDELGVTDVSLERVIHLSQRLLGLIVFFTVGPDETRAWTIHDGDTALEAAGAIHSDLARGFIRAEVVAWQDLLDLGSMAEARRAGRLRSEGRAYQVRDGDVIEILFNV